MDTLVRVRLGEQQKNIELVRTMLPKGGPDLKTLDIEARRTMLVAETLDLKTKVEVAAEIALATRRRWTERSPQ